VFNNLSFPLFPMDNWEGWMAWRPSTPSMPPRLNCPELIGISIIVPGYETLYCL